MVISKVPNKQFFLHKPLGGEAYKSLPNKTEKLSVQKTAHQNLKKLMPDKCLTSDWQVPDKCLMAAW